MKIDILTNDGSPLGVHLADVYGDGDRIGVGGAELALLTMCEAWYKAGHDIRLYNNPITPELSPFVQLPISTFIPEEDRDILIIFRSPNSKSLEAVGKKIWWSTDQYTVGSFSEFAPTVDKIVTISPFHSNYFEQVYGITNTTVIDLPVRVQDYEQEVERKRKSLLFCSVPDRGLNEMANIYKLIRQMDSEVTLTVTSDFRLWGVPTARNEKFVTKFLGVEGVTFLGAVPRRELVKVQLGADVQAYPCKYDELFCYATAECQVAGAYPVTTQFGALVTTNMGIQVEGTNTADPTWQRVFASAVVETLNNESLQQHREELMKKSRERFSLGKIMKEWDKVFDE